MAGDHGAGGRQGFAGEGRHANPPVTTQVLEGDAVANLLEEGFLTSLCF